MTTTMYHGHMSGPLTINPAHLSDDDWETIRSFLDAAKARGEVVEFHSRVELLTPADVAKRLGMSRSTVLRRIADGDLHATKVGTHNRIPLAEFERYSHELMRRMAEASADDIEAELFGE
ncbi:MAG: helix-turn-helix domain-containing protein [Acidimicrobiia bacterium]|nr:helix-turn-helix domain-containing protein [Acidimicrobiia bacterium]